MDVFLLPTGAESHELYCEIATPPPAAAGGPTTRWGRWADRARRMLAEAEAERQREASGEPPPSHGRIRRAIARRIAEAVAEQRLLWHLRHQTEARLVYPDDLTASRALEVARSQLTADAGRHLRWCIIDGLIAAVTGPALFFVPGPNVVSWYFAFRAVGHFFSRRGAERGRTLDWTLQPTPHLTAVRGVLTLDKDLRATRLDEIARALGLDRLTLFVERVAPGPS